MPSLWTNLDFPTDKRPPKLPAIRKYVHRAQKLVTRVVLPGADVSGEGTLGYITSRCKRLQELVVPRGMLGGSFLGAILCAENLKTLIVSPDCQVTSDGLGLILNGCKCLERAEFGKVSGWTRGLKICGKDAGKLQSLVLSSVSTDIRQSWNNIHIKTLGSKFPDIRILTIHSSSHQKLHQSGPESSDFTGFSRLKNLDISGLVLTVPLRLPSSIVSLDISNSVGLELDVEKRQFEHLAQLSIGGYQSISFWTLWNMLLPNLGNLTYFNAKKCYLSIDWLTKLVKGDCFKKVEELVLDRCYVTDDIAMLLAKHTTALRVLSLACTKVTGAGLRPLLNNSNSGITRKLEYLCLDDCSSCSLDVVEWARSMDIRVSFKFPDPKSGGRKVRLS